MYRPNAQRRRVISGAPATATVPFLLLATYLSTAQADDAHSVTAGARSHVSAETYERAERLLRNHIDGLLWNDRVIPHWLSARDEFWYERTTAAGHEFVLVEAGTGRKQSAFDHEGLAVALSRIVGQPVQATKLPFHEFTALDSQSLTRLRITVEGKTYICSLTPSASCQLTPPEPDGMLVSPDHHWAALTRDGNLWLRDLGSGAEHALTHDGEADFGYGIYPGGWKAASIPRERAAKPLPPMETYWSPDSHRLIVPRVDQRHVAPYPFVETAPVDGSFRPKLHPVRIALVGEKPATLEWYVFDIPSGQSRRIEYPYEKLLVLQQDLLAIRHTWWGPRNEHLYAVAFGDNMESAYLFDADLATGAVRTVINEQLHPRTDLNSTSYNPPNVRVTSNGREVIWFSQRDGWGHLYLYDVRTGALKNRITGGNWLVRDIVHVDERGRRIYFTGGGREPGNPYYRYLYRVDFDGSHLELLSPEQADHLITSPWNDVLQFDGAIGYDVISPSGKYAVYNVSPLVEPSSAVICSTATGHSIATFEHADASRLFAAGYRAPEEFMVKAADGRSDLYGVIYKPADFHADRRYPVIDTEYASPLTAVVPRNFEQAARGVPGYGSPASFAQLGFVVVAIDARGTTYRSREFSQYGYGKLNINGLDDHVAAIRQLAERFPYIDIDRVGITGASYGGWSAVRGMLEFPDFYKVGVAGVAPGGFHSLYLDYHWTAFQGRPRYSNGTEWRPVPNEVPPDWQATDSRRQAARLQGNLMLVLGELDENVPLGSPMQLVDAFVKANRDFDLVYLPGMNHYESANAYVIRRMWDYFVRHLEGAEPPEGYQFGEGRPNML